MLGADCDQLEKFSDFIETRFSLAVIRAHASKKRSRNSNTIATPTMTPERFTDQEHKQPFDEFKQDSCVRASLSHSRWKLFAVNEWRFARVARHENLINSCRVFCAPVARKYKSIPISPYPQRLQLFLPCKYNNSMYFAKQLKNESFWLFSLITFFFARHVFIVWELSSASEKLALQQSLSLFDKRKFNSFVE